MSIILCMIVRNEEKYIERCLNSVKPFIDLWCISDTGSTDNTKAIIRETLKDVPGVLHDTLWFDYSLNRNLNLDYARIIRAINTEFHSSDDDYLMVMDADDVFSYKWMSFKTPPDNPDGYQVEYRLGETVFKRPFLVRANKSWKYYGKCHEVLLRRPDDTLKDIPTLSGCHVDCNVGIDFKPPEHYLEHARLLEGETDPRSVFYLAQSYQMADQPEKAIEHYIRRTRMEGNREELYHSYFRLGQLTAEPGLFLKAAKTNPTRAEPWFELYQWAQGNGMPEADDFLIIAATKRKPQGMLIDTSIPKKISKILGVDSEML